MENVKYIPGDLVQIKNSTNRLIKDDTITKIVEVDRSRFVKVIIVNSGSNLDYQIDKKNIVPIPLTPHILETDGWKRYGGDPLLEYSLYKKYFDAYHIYKIKYHEDLKYCSFYHSYSNTVIKSNIKYSHQLQHLLFGLGLNSELKV